MSEFRELIKKFDKIRDYMRDFYVYGFKSREQLAAKSLRTYDDEKRRIESYLGEFMSFRQNEVGKRIFLSVDSTSIAANPLYRAFKAKSFTKNDITLHFILLDILQDGNARTARELTDCIDFSYLPCFQEPMPFDIATVRNKLKEYVALGLLASQKEGRNEYFSIAGREINWEIWKDAVAYFSEVSPLGVAGSYLLDRFQHQNSLFCYKHHYIMHAMESEIVAGLLEAIHSRRRVLLKNHGGKRAADFETEVVPLGFLISVQGGRRYLAVCHSRTKSIQNYRLDFITSVKLLEEEPNFGLYQERLREMRAKAWGASFGRRKDRELDYLEMTLHVEHYEQFIVKRLESEGRHGIVKRVDETAYQYSIEVYDAMEMLPWIRTFTGRILSLKCSNAAVSELFYKDFEEMRRIYDV